MSLRTRTILAVATLLLVALAIVGAIGRGFLLDNYTRLERDGMARDVDRALTALQGSATDLLSTSSDYALWNDMIGFVEAPSQAFIEDNLPLRMFRDLALDTMIVLDADGDIVFERAVDFERQGLAAVPDAARAALLSQTEAATANAEGVVAGVVNTPVNPLLVVRRPIRSSDGLGPDRGELIVVRRLNALEVTRLATATRLRLELIPFGTEPAKSSTSGAGSSAVLAAQPIEALLGLGPTLFKSALLSGDIRVYPVDDRTLIGEVDLHDLADQPVLTLRVSAGREIYQQGQRTVLFFILGVTAVGLLSGLIGLLFIEHLTPRPLERLTREVSAIAESGDASRRVSAATSLDLERMSLGVNRMLETLDRAQRDLAAARDDALEAARLKTQLFANVSHDLRTPINAVIGFAEMLGEGVYGSLSSEQSRVLKRIDRNARELLLQVNDLLEASSLESGRLPLRPTYFTADELLGPVRELGEGLALRKSLIFRIADATAGARLYGDPERLRQIALNLVHNAVKYTERGEVRVSVACDHDRWELAVADTGAGIPIELQAAIFEPFRQGGIDGAAQRGGVGLGLYIAREMAQRMGGALTVNSQPGQGSTFTLALPRSAHNGTSS